MADAARRRATYADLLGVAEHLVAEIIDGELVTSPRPASPHALAASSLGGELYGPFNRGKNGPSGWVSLHEPELHLQNDVLVPDLAGWRRERMPELPDTAAFELAPDWVCEVLSPSTAARDRADKVPIYLRDRYTARQIQLVNALCAYLEHVASSISWNSDRARCAWPTPPSSKRTMTILRSASIALGLSLIHI